MQLPFLKIHMGEPEPFFATFYFFGTSFTTQLLTKVNSNFPQVQYHGWEILDGLNSNKKQKFKYLQCISRPDGPYSLDQGENICFTNMIMA